MEIQSGKVKISFSNTRLLTKEYVPGEDLKKVIRKAGEFWRVSAIPEGSILNDYPLYVFYKLH
jgi:hypothetical protein